MNINNVTVVGNLTNAPAAGALSNGTAANMRVATHVEYAEAGSGEKVKRSDFFDVEAYGKLADNCLAELKKGDRIVVSGSLRYDEWSDDAGNRRSKAKIRAGVIGKSLEF